MSHCQNFAPRPLTRRAMLQRSGTGFGALALNAMLAKAGTAPPSIARAKRVIFLFMHGGPSTVDLFDPKPLLQRDADKPYPLQGPRIVSSAPGTLLASPWSFKQHGQSGAQVSELLPNIASVVDDLCFVRSMHCSNSRHGGALLELHTGSDTFTRPSMGSWINYGLGSENENLPGFITINPSGSHGGAGAWSSAFLPAKFGGTRIGGAMKIPFIDSPLADPAKQRRELDLLGTFNRDHLAKHGSNSELESRIASYELAFRMQMEVPGVQDISQEPDHIKKLYGADAEPTKSFAEQCLMARRYSEAGVRFVQVTHRYWDSHSDLRKDHTRLSAEMDKPVAGLISDLKQRGLLEDTLVLWGSEFGRTPTAQNNGKRDGREHNPHGFTMFMAGGGTKPGTIFGSTDEYGYYAHENPVHFHDLHATILHLMGIDHEQLTFRHAGRDFRLTDVHGEVVNGIIA